MWLQVDPRSQEPMYQQLVQGIKTAVAKGLLIPGDKLPSVRELSMELTLNHNTVAKAYQELERDGVIEVLRGRGTYISQDPIPGNLQERQNQLEHHLRQLVVEALHLQMSEEDVVSMVRRIASEMRTREEDPS